MSNVKPYTMEGLVAIEAALKESGIQSSIEHTGGGCYVLYVRGNGKIEIATDGETLSAYETEDTDNHIQLMSLEECIQGGVPAIADCIKANIWRV